MRILRHRTDDRQGKPRDVYAVTDLTSHQTSPQRLGRLAPSHSKIRTGHGPENTATLRNLAVNTVRTAGHQNVATSLRHASYEPFARPLDLLGIA